LPARLSRSQTIVLFNWFVAAASPHQRELAPAPLASQRLVAPKFSADS
jgi:hypothetical protein